MLHSWENLEKSMPKLKMIIFRWWNYEYFLKYIFFLFQHCQSWAYMAKCNKYEIKFFIIQKIYTAKLPYQIVVGFLYLACETAHFPHPQLLDHILPIFVFLPCKLTVPAILLNEWYPKVFSAFSIFLFLPSAPTCAPCPDFCNQL